MSQTQTKTKNKSSKQRWIGMLAFFAPIAITLLCFAWLEIYPFGGKSLLVVDMNNEYADYFVYMNGALKNGDGFFRSWNMGMGYNIIGLIAFYTNSILNIILYLIPVSWMTEGIMVVTLLKIGFGSWFFSIFARKTQTISPLFTVMFSTIYGLIGYTIAFSSNILWLDAVAVFPLVMLGIEYLLQKKSSLLLLISLWYTFVSCYYIGYMVGVFCILYLTVRYFSENNSLQKYVSKLLSLAGHAVVAAICGAFILIPAFLGLKNGQDGELFSASLSFAPQVPFVDIFSKFLPGVYVSLTDDGLPNLYCSLLVVLLSFFFFLCTDIPRRKKVAMGSLVVFLFASFSIRALYLAWHAFEDPTWFPARFSFVLSFVLLYLAMQAVPYLKSTQWIPLLLGGGILVFLIAEISADQPDYISDQLIALAIIFTLATLAVLLLQVLWPKRKQVFQCLLAVLVLAEVTFATYSTFQGVDEEFQYKTRDSYYDYRDTYQLALQTLPDEGMGFYRTEINKHRSANGGMALGYYSVSHYSSTTNRNVHSFLKALGSDIGTLNEVHYRATMPAYTAGLLGIEYLLSHETLDTGWELIEQTDHVYIYQNPYVYPMAFFANPDSLELNFAQSANSFEIQNNWTSMLFDSTEPIFTPIDVEDPTLINCKLVNNDSLVQYQKTANAAATITWQIDNPQQEELFLQMPLQPQKFADAVLKVNGQDFYKVLGYRSNTIYPLGNESQITVQLSFSKNNLFYDDISFVAFSPQAAQQAADLAQEYPMEITTFENNKVVGTIDAPEEGYLVTTFPYDNGWSIKVDGKKVSAEKYADVFMAIPVGAGEHEIVMSYIPPGFLLGSILSCCGIAGVIGYGVWTRKKGKAKAVKK